MYKYTDGLIVVRLDRQITGYSLFCRTEESRNVDRLFGLEDELFPRRILEKREPSVSSIASARIDQAFYLLTDILAMPAVSYFLDIARRFGHTISLPYDEIPHATNNNVSFDHLQEALRREYLREFELRFKPFEAKRMVELTDRHYRALTVSGSSVETTTSFL